MEDRAIVELFLRRDEAAIGETAKKYGSRLRALALSVTADAQTAEECENDTYLEAWKSIPPNDPRDYFYRYLARIIRHLSLNRCAERSRLKRSAELCSLSAELENCLPAADTVEKELERRMLGRSISTYLRGQSSEKRQMFLQRYYCCSSIREISLRLGIGESKVKTTLHRMRTELKAYLEKEGYKR